jgi:hypothetical protein
MAPLPQTDWGEYYHETALMCNHLLDSQINRLSNYTVGMTMEEARGAIVGYAVYLPLVSKQSPG